MLVLNFVYVETWDCLFELWQNYGWVMSYTYDRTLVLWKVSHFQSISFWIACVFFPLSCKNSNMFHLTIQKFAVVWVAIYYHFLKKTLLPLSMHLFSRFQHSSIPLRMLKIFWICATVRKIGYQLRNSSKSTLMRSGGATCCWLHPSILRKIIFEVYKV